jgi:hypothetical protein
MISDNQTQIEHDKHEGGRNGVIINHINIKPLTSSLAIDALPSPKLGPRWALVSKTTELWGLEGTP